MSWREKCRVVPMQDGCFDIQSPTRAYWWGRRRKAWTQYSDKTGTRFCGYFVSRDLAEAERPNLTPPPDAEAGESAALRERAERAERERDELAAKLKVATTPSMWWDAESPEDIIDEPEEYVRTNDIPDGVLKLYAARRLPTEWFRVQWAGDDVTLVPLTAEEIEAEKARRRQEWEAERVKRSTLPGTTATEGGRQP